MIDDKSQNSNFSPDDLAALRRQYVASFDRSTPQGQNAFGRFCLLDPVQQTHAILGDLGVGDDGEPLPGPRAAGGSQHAPPEGRDMRGPRPRLNASSTSASIAEPPHDATDLEI